MLFSVFPHDGLLHFLVPRAVFDSPNEVPACVVGLGHHVTVYTVAFFSGLRVTNRTLKIEGLFCNIHCGPHLSSILRGAGRLLGIWGGRTRPVDPLRQSNATRKGEGRGSYNPARRNNSAICRQVSSW
jgi:hypothetical protein